VDLVGRTGRMRMRMDGVDGKDYVRRRKSKHKSGILEIVHYYREKRNWNERRWIWNESVKALIELVRGGDD
jgi:hypothetical protein